MKVTVTGSDQAQATLKRKREYAPRAMKNAAKRMGTLDARTMKGFIKDRTGLLGKSIGSKVAEGKAGRLTVFAGPRRGFRTVIVKTAGRGKVHGLRQDKKGKLKKVVLAHKGV